jgi:hypothetical protein
MRSCVQKCFASRESLPGEVAPRRDLKMTTQNFVEPLKNGTAVKIRNSGYSRAWIAEYRGPLGPKGARIYRVLVEKKPRRVYVEVREDQLEVLDDA